MVDGHGNNNVKTENQIWKKMKTIRVYRQDYYESLQEA